MLIQQIVKVLQFFPEKGGYAGLRFSATGRGMRGIHDKGHGDVILDVLSGIGGFKFDDLFIDLFHNAADGFFFFRSDLYAVGAVGDHYVDGDECFHISDMYLVFITNVRNECREVVESFLAGFAEIIYFVFTKM